MMELTSVVFKAQAASSLGLRSPIVKNTTDDFPKLPIISHFLRGNIILSGIRRL
jgi:hypothetical protein